MTIGAPAITTRQSTQHGHQNKTAYRVDNYQLSKHVYMWHFTVFTVFNTLWTNMFIISSILTVAEGGSIGIYDVVSSSARGRALVDLRELFTMY